MGEEVIVLHPHGNKRHYEPLEYIDNIDLKYREFKFIEGKNISGFTIPEVRNKSKVSSNLKTLYNLINREKNKKLILAAEPFDPRIPLFIRLAKRHNVIYHTSWPFWNGDRVPYTRFIKKQTDMWRKFLNLVDIITVNKAAKKSLKRFGVNPVQIPHGVNTEKFSPKCVSQQQQAEVLFVGRYVQEKGIYDLLEIARRMNNEKIKFRFAGQGPLAGMIENSKSEHIENIGYIQSVRRLAKVYTSADVLVLPSYQLDQWEELFGIVLIESMACETPVIATNCIGPKEIITNDENGYIIPQRDQKSLENKIRLIVNDQNKGCRMGKSARKAILDNYEMTDITDQWEKEIKNNKQYPG
jgi:glycosyltransferase involved in cell wall biosynthesis